MGVLQLLLVFEALIIGKTFGLKCYQCVYYDGETDSEVLKLFAGKVNPQCRYPILGSVPVIDCPYGMQCGAASGKVSFSLPFVGQYSTEVVIRDCMPASGNGCEKPSDSQKNILNGVLKFLTGINIDDLRVCTCNTDECDAICGNDSVRIGPYCIKLWMVIIGASGGIIILLFLVTCCCCCCCCKCCKKSSSQGAIIGNTSQLYVATAVNPPHNIQFATYAPSANRRPPVGSTVEQPKPHPYQNNWDTVDDTAMLIA